jgi:glyoxylase-like metal-dependent hydrolase (beta-lactamase superfamily II)
MSGQWSYILPVAENWFVKTQINESVTLIEQRHVHPFLQANIWHVRGTDRDVLIDSGLGVVPLKEHLIRWFGREPVLALTHAHLDHMGSAYEFSECWAHSLEPVSNPGNASLGGEECLRHLGVQQKELLVSMPPLLIESLPYAGYQPSDYRLRPGKVTRALHDEDTIDLGDRVFHVCHMPGHSPGSIGFYDRKNLALFSGDVIYDDELVDYVSGSNVNDYVITMRRLKTLPVSEVYPGHCGIFGRTRMIEIATTYTESKCDLTA